MIPGLQGNYCDKLRQLGLTTLEERRRRFDMIEAYKILHGFTAACDNFLKYQATREGAQTRAHSTDLLQKCTFNTDLKKHYFTVRIVDSWNSLPYYIRHAHSVASFKYKYDKYFSTL